MHDVGKVLVLPDLVNATRKLTPAEEEEMKKHAWAGYEYLRKEYSFGDQVNETVYQHHEWYNGGGYPNLKRQGTVAQCKDIKGGRCL